MFQGRNKKGKDKVLRYTWEWMGMRTCYHLSLKSPGLRYCAVLGAGLWATGLLLALSAPLRPGQREEQHAGKPPTFQEVKFVLETHCFKCHGEDRRESRLDLRTRKGMIQGGQSGPALVPGDESGSLLFEMISSGRMPPQGESRPSQAQVALIQQWISGGALAPAHRSEVPPVDLSGLSDEDRSFWSFRSPVRPEVPQVSHRARVRTPIDAFILKKLEEKNLALSPEADRRMLIRRACFDLIGLPPTPGEIDDFVDDDQPGAYERLLDRLLASPRYGERWGRHWLDAVGYADSDGHWDSDNVRESAYRYRDYVIRSFNADKPYDQFLLEQVAGDEMVDLSAEKLEPEMVERLEATGFLRTGADPTYEDYNLREYRYTAIDNTIRNFGSSVMGLTMHCAKCHDHKFDPIPQRDYYRLEAILKPAYDPDRWIVSEKRGFTDAALAEQERARVHNEPLDKEIAGLAEQLIEQRLAREDQLLAKKLIALPEILRMDVRAALRTGEEDRSEVQRYLVAKFRDQLEIDEDELAGAFPGFKEKDAVLEKAIEALKERRIELPHIRGLKDVGAEVPATYVRLRGKSDAFGEKVGPGPPSVLRDPNRPFRVPDLGPEAPTSGLRTALAQWIVHPEHPLTSRVMVNRIWQYHFGEGLVRTPDNFGSKGRRPTHPQLLDWLASEFVRRDWSLKAVHRLIMSSSVYMQTSHVDEARAGIDPGNLLWWRMPLKRADAEAFRDSILAVSGTLNLEMYGPPVPVEANEQGEAMTSNESAAWRRSVYLAQRRSRMLTLLKLFDAPVMEYTCPRRERSTLPTQALHLLNSNFTILMSQHFARRILDEMPEAREKERIGHAYRLAFGREPSDRELKWTTRFLEEQEENHLAAPQPQGPPAEPSGRTSGEIDAGKGDGHVEIEEDAAAQRLEPPPGAESESPPEVKAKLEPRFLAWSDLCHMLMSANEFVYID